MESQMLTRQQKARRLAGFASAQRIAVTLGTQGSHEEAVQVVTPSAGPPPLAKMPVQVVDAIWLEWMEDRCLVGRPAGVGSLLLAAWETTHTQ